MPELRLAELVQATGGSLVRGEPEATVALVRHRHAATGAGRGVLRAQGQERRRSRLPRRRRGERGRGAVIAPRARDGQPAPPAVIRVDDVQQALARAARWVRGKLSRVKWIAVTGSNGKTTTKELLAEGLAGRRPRAPQPGELQQPPRRAAEYACAVRRTPRSAVIEMGDEPRARSPSSTRIVEPDVGLVTNVRAAHLASSSLDGRHRRGQGRAVRAAARRRDRRGQPGRLRTYESRPRGTRARGSRSARTPPPTCAWKNCRTASFPASASSCVTRTKRRRVQLQLGRCPRGVQRAGRAGRRRRGRRGPGRRGGRDRTVEAGPGWGKVHQLSRGMLLVDDSYNSSPGALASVLETVRLSEPDGRKVLVMGDMLELGPMQGRAAPRGGQACSDGRGRDAGRRWSAVRARRETARRAGVPEVHHHADSSKAADAVGRIPTRRRPDRGQGLAGDAHGARGRGVARNVRGGELMFYHLLYRCTITSARSTSSSTSRSARRWPR